MAKKKQIELTIEEKLQNALVPKEEEPYKIPSNWCWVRLGNITQIKGGKRIPKGTSLLKENTGYKYIRVTDMKNGTVLNDDIHYISKDIYNKISNYTISKNDIYITCAGTIGRVGIIPVEFDGANLTENADKIIIKHINKYLLVKILSSYIVQKQIQEVITTGCQPKLAIKKIEQLKIPLPPINEQQRIVERIESLFAKLDRAKELIENTLAQFEQNKMAILHKAFTGELTAKWRKKQKIIKKNTWQLVNIKTVSNKIFAGGDVPKDNMSIEKTDEFKVPIYTNGEKNNGLYGYTNEIKVKDDAITISARGTIGYTVIRKAPFYPAIRLITIIPNIEKINIGFLYYVFNFFKVDSAGSSIPQLTVPMVKDYNFELPTIEEQQEIVNILDKLLAKYNKIKNLEQQLEKIELLKKAILAKAFRGELGTNNPDEESAENLLKEILAEK